MKYIDTDKLKEEVEKRRKFHDNAIISFCNSQTIRLTHSAGLKEDEEILSLIDSLQQEQDLIIINKKDWEAQEQFRKDKDFGKPLKEEQPKKSKKDCNGCPHCVDRKDQYGWHFKGCFGGPYKGKFIAEIDECPLEQEHSEMDLEKEISTWIPAHIRGGDNEVWKDTKKAVTEWGGIVARHFYELGKNARKA